MSILKVDTINEKTSGNGVLIPGHVIQYLDVHENTSITFSSNASTNINLGLVKSITPLHSSSKIVVEGHIGVNIASSSNDAPCLRCLMNGTVQTAAMGWGGIGSNGNHFIAFYHDQHHQRDLYTNLSFKISSTGLLTAGTSYSFQLQLRNWQNNSNTLIYNGSGYLASTMRIMEIAQ